MRVKIGTSRRKLAKDATIKAHIRRVLDGARILNLSKWVEAKATEGTHFYLFVLLGSQVSRQS